MGVRVQLGKLDVFGLAGQFGLMVKTGIIGSGTNTLIDDSGLKVTDGGGVERVRVGALGGSDYGLRVTNAGSTVIIDGSANVFKIRAAGSLSLTIGAWSSGNLVFDSTGVTLSGLGTMATPPAHLSFLGPTSLTTDLRRIGQTYRRFDTPMYVASTSGGSPTSRIVGYSCYGLMSTQLTVDDEARVALTAENAEAASVTWHGYFHVLKEAAL